MAIQIHHRHPTENLALTVPRWCYYQQQTWSGAGFVVLGVASAFVAIAVLEKEQNLPCHFAALACGCDVVAAAALACSDHVAGHSEVFEVLQLRIHQSVVVKETIDK